DDREAASIAYPENSPIDQLIGRTSGDVKAIAVADLDGALVDERLVRFERGGIVNHVKAGVVESIDGQIGSRGLVQEQFATINNFRFDSLHCDVEVATEGDVCA